MSSRFKRRSNVVLASEYSGSGVLYLYYSQSRERLRGHIFGRHWGVLCVLSRSNIYSLLCLKCFSFMGTVTYSYWWKRKFFVKKTKPLIELGTPQHYHVTMQSIMFSGRKVVGYFSIFLFVVANPFRPKILLNIFLSLKLYYVVACVVCTIQRKSTIVWIINLPIT